MPKGNRVGKQSVGRLKINIQLFAKGRNGVVLPKKEYGKIIREIDDLYNAKDKDQKTFVHYSGDYKYTVRNISYNQYQILTKRKIK